VEGWGREAAFESVLIPTETADTRLA
jgi:hypothetical protein